MLRKLIGYVLLVFVVGNSTVHARAGEQIMRENLERIGSAYQELLSFAGMDARDSLSIDAEADSLFAANFKKVVNNQMALEGSDKFGSYLWEFREKLGRWKIQPNVYSSIPSRDGYITITYTVETIDREEAMKLIVIAILKVDADGKIVEVFEVDHAV